MHVVIKLQKISSFSLLKVFSGAIFCSRGQNVAGWVHGRLFLQFCHKNFKFHFWRLFFLQFFHLSCRQFKGGYTCDFRLVLGTRQNLKKSHQLCEQKIACVAMALDPIASQPGCVNSNLYFFSLTMLGT